MTDVDRELHIAIIGLGRMGKIYARTIAEMAGARLYAVATIDAAEEADFLADYDVAFTFESADEIFRRIEVDAVVIATPTNTHSELVLKAAAAGKAVFCEKPLALTLEDTRAILDGVERAGIPLQVGFMRRFDRRFAGAKAAIDAGRIGRPVSFKGVGRDPICPPPELADPKHSGGLIIDMGIHDFDLARWMMKSEVERVSAVGTTAVCDELRSVGDLDNAVVNLGFTNGAIGNVEVSRNAFYGYDVRAEVLGSEGAVRVGHTDHGTQLLAAPDPSSNSDYLMHRFGEAYRRQIRHFVASVRDGLPPWPAGNDALAAFEIALAATFAAGTGRTVTLDEVRAGWTPE